MSEMLHEGRIPLAEAEHAAVDKLIEKHPDASVSFSRRDPNSTDRSRTLRRISAATVIRASGRARREEHR